MSRIKNNISWIITFLFLAFFVYYFFANLDSFKPLLEVSIAWLVVICLLRTGIFSMNGLLIKVTVDKFTKPIQLGETFVVAIYSAIGNFFGPLLGGATIRAAYLKKHHNLSYSKFVSTLGGYFYILFLINSVLAVVSLLVIQNNEGTESYGLTLFFTAWVIGLLGVALIKLPERYRGKGNNRATKLMLRFIYEAYDGWRYLISDKKMFAKLALIATSAYLINYLLNYIEFRVLDIPISLASLGLYTSLAMVSILIAITPGAIGIRETLLLLASGAMGLTNDQIVQVAILDRSTTYVVLLVLGLVVRSYASKYHLEDIQKKED